MNKSAGECKLFFSEGGRRMDHLIQLAIERHDYTAEIVGPWARGSHFTSSYSAVQNFMVAGCRDVYARLGSLVTPIPVLHARIEAKSISQE